MTEAPYELYYWPTIQGRGEFIRLAFEEAGADYVDVARLPEGKGGGVKAMMRVMREAKTLHPFAPPFVKVGDVVVAQTANILSFLAPRLHLVQEDDANRAWANQIQLTIADFIVEAHDVHHPVASSLYYEDQIPESLRRAPIFTSERIPKFLGYFERLLTDNGTGRGVHLLGAGVTYVDLSMFQVMAGLDFAFPKTMRRLRSKYPKLAALAEHVAKRPRIAAYLASERRIAFNQQGIFRHYPELDIEP